MNTNTKKDQKNQRQKTRQVQRTAKQGQNPAMLAGRRQSDHEQEHAETRMTR
jgi:hypothetical protein